LSRLAAPAGAFGALAVAVGVWLIPGSALDPAPLPPPARKPMPGQAPPVITAPAPPTVDWTALAQHLEALRTPDATIATDEANGELLTPNQPSEPIAPPPPMELASWQYEGHVRDGDRLIALVRIAAVQRFVFVDQEIKDPSIPGAGVATIKSIDEDRILVVVDGRELEVKRSKPAQSNTLVREQFPRPGGLE
jgi:hypothetical protein